MGNLNNSKAIDFENRYIQDLGVDISGIMPGTHKKERFDSIQWALETDKKYRKIRKKQITKREWEVRLNLGADYLYYDLFSQIWGWGKYQYPEYKCKPEDAIMQLQSAMQKQQHKNISNQRPYNKHLQFQIGAAYLMGWLPSDNREQTAITWFRRSAEQDSAQGLMALGYCYEKEIGGLQDDPENWENMMDCYGEAAEKRYEPALYRLAKCLFEQEDSAFRIQRIKELLKYKLHYKPVVKPAAELLEEVKALEDKIHREQEAEIQGTPQKSDEEAFEDLWSLFQSAPDDGEVDDNEEDWEDEEDWEEEEDWDDEADWEEEENSEELWEEDDPRIVPYIEALKKLDWGMDGIKPTGHWLIRMGMLLYQMNENVGNDHWSELSYQYNTVLKNWLDEERERREKSAEKITDQFLEESVPQADLGTDEWDEMASDQKVIRNDNRTEQEVIWKLSSDEIERIADAVRKKVQSEFISVVNITQETYKTVLDTNRTTYETRGMVADIQKTVRTIMDFQQTQNQLWRSLLETDAVGEKQKTYIRQLQSETESALSDISRENDSALEQEEEFLALIFGSDWRNEERLCNSTCDSLVTARVLMRYGSKVGITNYSGIIITAVGALEIETRRRFFDAYVGYLEELGTESRNFPENLTRHKRADGSFYYTLGALRYILSPRVKGKNPAGEARTRYSDKGEPFYYDNRVDDFLRDCVMSRYAKEIQRKSCYDREHKVFQFYIPAGSEQSFIGLVDTITKKYRNKAAHADMCVLTREDAEECCGVLGIRIGEERYAQLVSQESSVQAQKDLLNIEGLLKELLRLTRPLEIKKETTN